MDTAQAPLLIDRSTPAVAILTLNRPEARNALNSALRNALKDAFEALVAGQAESAAGASAMGLVREVVAVADGLSMAMAMASSIAAVPALAVAQIKEAVLAGHDAALDTGLLLERRACQLLFDSE